MTERFGVPALTRVSRTLSRKERVRLLRLLTQMTTAEIAHRLRERLRRETDRIRVQTGNNLGEDRELDALIQCHGSLKNYFTQMPARRFYSSTHDRDATTHFITTHYPAWFDRAVQQAARGERVVAQ